MCVHLIEKHCGLDLNSKSDCDVCIDWFVKLRSVFFCVCVKHAMVMQLYINLISVKGAIRYRFIKQVY